MDGPMNPDDEIDDSCQDTKRDEDENEDIKNIVFHGVALPGAAQKGHEASKVLFGLH